MLQKLKYLVFKNGLPSPIIQYCSCVGLDKPFALMFLDSEIAKKYQVEADKLAHMASYGLTPYFKSSLLSSLLPRPSMNCHRERILKKTCAQSSAILCIIASPGITKFQSEKSMSPLLYLNLMELTKR